MNESLIQDPKVIKKIEGELEEFFTINDTPEISIPTLWESHKAYIRCILMLIGAQKKKKRRESLDLLLKEIQEIEQQSWPKGTPERQELIKKMEELASFLDQETKGAFFMVMKEKYQWGNKPGKLLAKILWEKKNVSFVLKIRDEKGEMVYSSSEIARVFHAYYSKLYSVSQLEDLTGRQKKDLEIQHYLWDQDFPSMSKGNWIS